MIIKEYFICVFVSDTIHSFICAGIRYLIHLIALGGWERREPGIHYLCLCVSY